MKAFRLELVRPSLRARSFFRPSRRGNLSYRSSIATLPGSPLLITRTLLMTFWPQRAARRLDPPDPGGDAELSHRYRHTAVGKLGVVVSPDRPPRLVVDSSVSGVTSNTHLPNKAPNPSLADVRKCLPLCPANESLAALVLDFSKAHRRVRIKPEDQGLLCFRHRDVLYQSLTLNFGARASGFYWNRVAGLLLRLTHRLWHVRHSAQIYVDDLLAILLRSSAPLLSAPLVVMLCVLRVPMSWHQAALSARVTWIGWSFDLEHYTVELDPAKLRRLLELLRLLSASPRCTVSSLEKLTGKLLWLSNLFQAFRPSLAPLYVDHLVRPVLFSPL